MHIQSLSSKRGSDKAPTPWQFRQEKTKPWLPAQVPGSVHTDLLALEQIPDPFIADNERAVQWVAESNWEYRCSFDVNPALMNEQHVFLVCDGLDTLAEVTLNGQPLGKTHNMFRKYRWGIKSLLQAEENELRILFRSPVQDITAKQTKRPLRGVTQAIPGGPYIRKAPSQFGWDWGPQLPPIGIWKDIRLEGRSVARLDDVHLRQHHEGSTVKITAQLVVERWQDPALYAVMRVKAPDGAPVGGAEETTTPVSDTNLTLSLPIDNPQLWWPNGYGAQPLYEVEIVLKTDNGIQDQKTYQIGLRTLELRQAKDAAGQSFTFFVNGVPIFAKGANWIPADSFPTRISDAHLERLIQDTAATHQNMLRVWGGGFYEEERFYDLCDQYGILVWQDFVFSCSIYPMTDEAFVENVRIEVIEALRRLRHHASLALWCGNNEMEWGWEEWGWDTPENEDLKNAYDNFFHHLLPEWCAEEDPDHTYWPSSPSSNTPFENSNSETQGDMHYWGVWHGGQPFVAYRALYPRFMSEFGFQALPPLETIRSYAMPQDWNMTSYIMEYHQRSQSGNSKMLHHMGNHFRFPKDFPTLVYLTQVVQAEAIRMGVEHWRRNRDRVSGTLYWQLNDCWPVASWSSLDYFGRWKALHYAAKRFYDPLLLSLEDVGQTVDVHLTSDLTEAWEGTVRWSLQTLSGDVITSGQEAVSVPPLTSISVMAKDFTPTLGDRQRELVFIAELCKDNQCIARRMATFVPNKHLKLADPELSIEVSPQEDDGLSVAVTAQSLARFVALNVEGADVVFSDNYFDIPAGETVTVTCPLPEGWTVAQVQEALDVMSLYASFTE
jgi:beta-mannosidase